MHTQQPDPKKIAALNAEVRRGANGGKEVQCTYASKTSSISARRAQLKKSGC